MEDSPPAYDITYTNSQGFTKNHQMSIVGKVNNFTYEDLLQLADNNDIKREKAMQIMATTIDVVAEFRQRTKKLNIRKNLIDLVSGDLRLDLIEGYNINNG